MNSLRYLIKPTIFTLGFCGTCFCGAAVAQYENKLKSSSYKDWYVRRRISRSFETLRDRRGNLTKGDRVLFSIITVNGVVFLGWKFKALFPYMSKYFLNSYSRAPIRLSTMILSNFSHHNSLHIGFNMIALYSFSKAAMPLLGCEQFAGLYLSACAVSSLTSLMFRIPLGIMTASLGASGAILSIVAYLCVKRPEDPVLLMFIPMTAGLLLKIFVGIDVIGLLARWSFIDHAAHLGGVATGVWYAMYGQEMYMKHRSVIGEKWSSLKNIKV